MEQQFITHVGAAEANRATERVPFRCMGFVGQHMRCWGCQMRKRPIKTNENDRLRSSFNFKKSSKDMYISKKEELRVAIAADIEAWVKAGNCITHVPSRKRRRYVNAVPLSPITQARCQMVAVRKAEAKRVAHLFPSSVDPGVACALSRGRRY